MNIQLSMFDLMEEKTELPVPSPRMRVIPAYLHELPVSGIRDEYLSNK